MDEIFVDFEGEIAGTTGAAEAVAMTARKSFPVYFARSCWFRAFCNLIRLSPLETESPLGVLVFTVIPLLPIT